jgi:hypothetical protein
MLGELGNDWQAPLRVCSPTPLKSCANLHKEGELIGEMPLDYGTRTKERRVTVRGRVVAQSCFVVCVCERIRLGERTELLSAVCSKARDHPLRGQ